jgi:hypothetical protein
MSTTHPVEEYFTAADVARMVDRTPSAIIQAANAGRISVTARTKGGVRLFTRHDVEQFAQKCSGQRKS